MSIEHPPLLPDDATFDDPDNPEWTEEMFARAKAEEHLLPPQIRALIKRPRGRPVGTVKAAPKVAVKLRLDPDVLEAFKGSGPGWQTRINAALRDAIDNRRL